MAQNAENVDSIYDFLYLDKNKVRSWLAQLIAEGVEVSTKFVGTKSTTQEVSGNASVAGILGGALKSTDQGLDTLERNFNAEWGLPLTLIDTLEESGFLHQDMGTTPIGSLVLISGVAQIMDIKFLKRIWAPLTEFLKDVQTPAKRDIDLLDQRFTRLGVVLNQMPDIGQAYFKTDTGHTAWCVLHPEHLTVDLAALTLAHGALISGTWQMVAVLDAEPDEGSEFYAGGMIGSEFSQMIARYTEPMRHSVGRHPSSYAVSPIAIFRAIPSRS